MGLSAPPPPAPHLIRRITQLTRGPAAVRRVTRASVFLLESATHLTRSARKTPMSARGRARRLAWMAEQMGAVHGIDVVVRGPRPPEAAVLVANHLSYIDAIAVLAHAPALPIAKREVAEWPLLGELMRELGVLFVERGDAMSGARVLRSALRTLREGTSIFAFPEGTTTLGDRVLPFKRGVFGLARIAEAPVVPITLRYESAEPCWVGDEPFLPHYLRTSARSHTRVHLTFGAPMTPSAYARAEELAETARHQVAACLCEA